MALARPLGDDGDDDDDDARRERRLTTTTRAQALRHVRAFREYLLGDEAAAFLSARATRGRARARSFDAGDEVLTFDASLKRKRRTEGRSGRGTSESTASEGDAGRDDAGTTSASERGGAKRRFAMRPPAMTRERRADMASAEMLDVGAEMRCVMRTLMDGEYEAFPPHDLLRSVWRLVPSFAGNEQQDAHEFMRFLLDRLRKELSSGKHAVKMRGTLTPRRKEHSPCENGIPNPPTRARSVRSRSGRSSPSPSFLRNDDDDDDDETKSSGAARGSSPVNGLLSNEDRRVDDGDEDGGYIIMSRWGPKRHDKGCICRPCKAQAKKEAQEGVRCEKSKTTTADASTHLSSPSSTFASPSRLSRGVTASEVKRQLEESLKGSQTNGLKGGLSPTSPKTPQGKCEQDDGVTGDKIMEIFGGVAVTTVTCMKCERSSERREPFMDLSLPIPPVVGKNGSVPSTPVSPSVEIEEGEGPNGEATLQQCLAAFVRNETLSGHGRYFCDGCGKVQSATKSTRIAKLPPVLCLHLKRFTWKGHAMRTKLTHDVDFPLDDLDLAPYCETNGEAVQKPEKVPASTGKSRRTPRKSAIPPAQVMRSDKMYDLVAVVTHHGLNAGSGHYTACAREFTAEGNSDWQHFNDDDVNSLTAEEVRTGQGYIFLYARK